MIFSENNLYGWGASNIAMPRAVFERHPHGLKRTGEISLHSRRGGVVCRWRSSSIHRIFLDDDSWRQTLFLGIFFSLIFVYIYLLNSTLPGDQNGPLTRSVEIVVALHKDEPRKETYPVKQEAFESLEPEKIKQDVIVESVTEEPREKITDRPKELKQAVSEKIPQAAPEPPYPDVEIKQRIVPQKVQEPHITASAMPVAEKLSKLEKITMAPPAVRKRNYRGRDTIKISQPRQVDKTADFKSTKNKTPTENILDTGPPQRRTKDKLQNNQLLKDPQLKITTSLIAPDQSDETGKLTLPKTDLARRRYDSKTKMLYPAVQPAPTIAKQQVAFQSQRSKQTPGLEPKSPAGQSSKTWRSPPGASKEAGRAIRFTPPRQQIEFTGTKVSRNRQTDKRYAFKKSDQARLHAPWRAKQELSFQSQKWEENSKLAPPVSIPLQANTNRSVRKDPNYRANAHNFSASPAPEEVDPSDLISLQEFNVCKDPEKEFPQKTQLAAHLLGPSRIEAEGVVFFVKYTESGYTIEIHIYNPHGRPFIDRCEVLELAINSIANRTN